jgi:hypothetical protein
LLKRFEEEVEVHRLLGGGGEARVVQGGVEDAIVPVDYSFGGAFSRGLCGGGERSGDLLD